MLSASSWLVLAAASQAQVVSDGQPGPETETRVEDVVVTGAPFGLTQRATTLATTVVTEEELAVAPAQSLGDLVNGLPGVRSTNFAPGASRPVIRGLSGPRVQVLTNGVGLIDASSVSPDHQVATDPAEANRIEIIRGPATLAYGGTAIGGVVNVLDGRIPEELPEGGVDGQVSAQASSVDDGWSTAGRVTVGFGPVALHLDGVRKRSEDYRVPVSPVSQRLADAEGIARPDLERVPNSSSELSSWGVGASFIGDRGFVGLSHKDLSSTYGVIAEPDVFIELEQRRQDLRGELRFDDGPFRALRGTAGRADYTHTEFEGPGQPGTVFTSEGWEARAELVQRARSGWNGALGVQMLDRDFDAVGDEAYVPSTRIKEAGLFTVQRLDRPGWGLEGGLRYDRRTLEAMPLSGGGRVEREYDNWSGSIAGFLRPSDEVFWGLSFAHNERAPSEIELFADGVHVATGAYESGDVTLGKESVNTLELSGHYGSGRFDGDVHVYASRYDGFIDLRPTGADYVDPGSGEAFPIFAYVQTDADIVGFELEGSYDLLRTSSGGALALEAAADWVRAETGLGPAARIPPWSVTTRLAYHSTPWDAHLEVRHVGEQDRLAGFELPTDGYTLVNLSGAWRPFGEEGLTLFAEASNLLDQEAREHVSFLKDLAPLPGRNIRLGLAYRF